MTTSHGSEIYSIGVSLLRESCCLVENEFVDSPQNSEGRMDRIDGILSHLLKIKAAYEDNRAWILSADILEKLAEILHAGGW